MVLQEYDIFSSASVGKKFWKIRPGNKAFLKALNITETLVKLGPKETHIIRKKVEKGYFTCHRTLFYLPCYFTVKQTRTWEREKFWRLPLISRNFRPEWREFHNFGLFLARAFFIPRALLETRALG